MKYSLKLSALTLVAGLTMIPLMGFAQAVEKGTWSSGAMPIVDSSYSTLKGLHWVLPFTYDNNTVHFTNTPSSGTFVEAPSSNPSSQETYPVFYAEDYSGLNNALSQLPRGVTLINKLSLIAIKFPGVGVKLAIALPFGSGIHNYQPLTGFANTPTACSFFNANSPTGYFAIAQGCTNASCPVSLVLDGSASKTLKVSCPGLPQVAEGKKINR